MNDGLDNKTREKIIGVAKACFPKAKIYLFGSRARGTFRRDSDIDIAIDAGEKQERVDIGEVRDMLRESNIMHKIDVVDLHNVPQAMKENILRDAVLWKN